MYPPPQYHPVPSPDDSWPPFEGPPPAYHGESSYEVHPYGAPPPPPYGPLPWGIGPAQPMRAPSIAPAFATAAAFGACALLSFILAFASWDGIGNPHLGAAVIGVVFSDKLTGNIDFGISATMTAACTTLTFAGILTARLAFARWTLIAIGALVSVYYLIAVGYLVAHGAGRFVGGVLIALLLWGAATVIAALPATAQAMRGHGHHPPPAHPVHYG